MLVREKGEVDWEDPKFFMVSSKCEEFVAEKYAEYCYDQDPCNPENFEMVVEVLNDDGEIKVFDVSAEAYINFSADERDGEE